MLISQFGVFGKGKVSVIPNIGDKVASGDFKNMGAAELSDVFTWPNNVDVVPTEVFGEGVNGIIVPDGFLVPFHNNGEVYVITTDPADISKAQHVYQLTK